MATVGTSTNAYGNVSDLSYVKILHFYIVIFNKLKGLDTILCNWVLDVRFHFN